MKINKLKLNNFRSVKNSVFEFSKQLNLFVGVNGSGKSTILDALSISLSWLVKRIEQENAHGFDIPDSSLSINQDNGYLELYLSEENTVWQWLLTKTEKGKISTLDSSFDDIDKLAEIIREKHKQQLSWPVIVYYPVNRMVNNISPNIPDQDSFYKLDVFENALDGVANYQSFFEWFRVQDDILNEQLTSRSKWVQKNYKWIKMQVDLLISSFKRVLETDNKDFNNEEYQHFFHPFEKDNFIYKEPQLFFLELTHLMNIMDIHFSDHLKYEKIIHDLEYMFHKMGSLSREFKDNLIEDKGLHKELILRIMNNFESLWDNKNSNQQMMDFLWQAFEFSLILSLWWFSEQGKEKLKKELGFGLLCTVIPNNHFINKKNITEAIQKLISQEIQQLKNRISNVGQELHHV